MAEQRQTVSKRINITMEAVIGAYNEALRAKLDAESAVIVAALKAAYADANSPVYQAYMALSRAAIALKRAKASHKRAAKASQA